MQKIILGPVLLTGIIGSLHAQENPQTTPIELPGTLVTATRSQAGQTTLATASTVYTRADIERLQVQTLPDLLRGSTGIDVTQSGGMGKLTDIFMRGTNSDHVLVLVDGIKIGSATTGTSPFEFIPIDQVERVEIIRGPQSSLYGSEAIGGVIQIFTRKGAQSETPKISLDAGGGSFHTHKESGNISGQWKNNWYSLGASNMDTEGFSSRQAIPGPYGFYQPDHDGYQNTAMNARAGHRFDSHNAELEASFMHSEGHSAYDATYGGDNTDFLNQVISLNGALDVLDNWHTSLRLGRSHDENVNYFSGKPVDSFFNSTRWNQSWLNEVTLSAGQSLIIGQDFRLDEVDSTTKYSKNSRYDVGGFVEYRGQYFDKHFLTASIRGDGNEAFGNYLTGNIGWRSNWDYGISSFASFGNAFKAPSFNDLYWPNYGNAKLAPEESTSVEVGLAGKHDYFGWELRAYHTNIDNLITPVMDPVTYRYSAENIGKAQIDGIEAEVTTQIMGWRSKLSMNLLSPVNRESNAQLPRRSPKTLSLDLSKSFGPVDVGTYILAQDYRYDDPANSIKVDGFVTVDLRAAYHINKNWLLSAKLNNLLDKNYQTINTYNTADRNFFVSIHYNN